jgi:sugar transferase (PEP-CTERM/EpsH1 system associated)
MRQIRILHCIFNPEIGGMQNGLVNVINHLNREDLIHGVCAFEPAPSTKGSCLGRIRNPRCQIFQLQRSRGNDPKLVAGLVNVIRRFKPTVVHTRNWATYAEGCIAATLAGSHCVVHGEHGTPFFDGWKHRWAYRCLAMKTRLVVTVSDSLNRLYMENCGRWAAKVRTIRNGVDDVLFCPARDRAAPKRALGLAPDALVVGCVGRLVPIKGFDLLIRAMPEVLRQLPRTRFVMVGPGPELANLTDLAQQCGVLDKVTFLGNRGDPQLCYQAMDLYVSTSRWEGISNTVLEALACGVPVVATAVGGTPEVLHHVGDGGVLTPSENVERLACAIVDVLADDNGLRRRSEAAREAVRRHFSLRKMLESYESMYREVSCG